MSRGFDNAEVRGVGSTGCTNRTFINREKKTEGRHMAHYLGFSWIL